MLNLKKLIQKEAEKAILKKAVGKILPMNGEPKAPLGPKDKLAGGLAALGAFFALLSQFLAG
jgi:hypothetical protein